MESVSGRVAAAAEGAAGVEDADSIVDVAMPLVTCAGETCRSGDADLADASWVPVHPDANATVHAASATVIF